VKPITREYRSLVSSELSKAIAHKNVGHPARAQKHAKKLVAFLQSGGLLQKE
jgi:hypothetical protein